MQRLAEVLLAAVGIWWIVMALPSMPYAIRFLTAMPASFDQDALQILSSTSFAIVHPVVGLFLLFGRGRIAARLVGGEPAAVVGRTSWQAPAIAVVGVYFASEGLCEIVRYALTASSSYPGVRVSNLMLPELFKLALGILLFLSARRLSLLWHRLHFAGGASSAG